MDAHRQLPQTKENYFLSNSTKFTLCVYWQRKPDGSFYNVQEINAKRHRKYIDSYDYHIGEGFKSITRHDEAFYKLLVYAQKNIHNIVKAVIFLNEFVERKQYMIAKLSQNELDCQIVYPSFTNPADTPLNHVYVDGLKGLPLETYDLVQKVLTKKSSIHNIKNVA